MKIKFDHHKELATIYDNNYGPKFNEHIKSEINKKSEINNESEENNKKDDENIFFRYILANSRRNDLLKTINIIDPYNIEITSNILTKEILNLINKFPRIKINSNLSYDLINKLNNNVYSIEFSNNLPVYNQINNISKSSRVIYNKSFYKKNYLYKSDYINNLCNHREIYDEDELNHLKL